jgi:translation initiation factor 2 beta subunit (eIF-2beta)/eIF-5
MNKLLFFLFLFVLFFVVSNNSYSGEFEEYTKYATLGPAFQYNPDGEIDPQLIGVLKQYAVPPNIAKTDLYFYKYVCRTCGEHVSEHRFVNVVFNGGFISRHYYNVCPADWLTRDIYGRWFVIDDNYFRDNYTWRYDNIFFRPETEIKVFQWTGQLGYPPSVGLPDELLNGVLVPYSIIDSYRHRRSDYGDNYINSHCFYYNEKERQYYCRFCNNPKYGENSEGKKFHIVLRLKINNIILSYNDGYNVCLGDWIIKENGRYSVVKDKIFY